MYQSVHVWKLIVNILNVRRPYCEEN